MGFAEEDEGDPSEEEGSGGEGEGAEEVRQGAAIAVLRDGVKDELAAFGEEFSAGATGEAGVFVGDGEELDAAHEKGGFVGAVDFAEIIEAAAVIFGDVDDAGANVFGAGGGDGPEEASVECERRRLFGGEGDGRT